MSSFNVSVQNLADAKDLGRVNDLLARSLNRLSSGTRMIKASDDPAGVGAVSKYESQNKRAQAAIVNIQNAVSLVQTSTGFMGNIVQIVSRMSELSEYATDKLKSSNDIALYQTEFKQLQDQLRQTIGGPTAEIGGTTGVTDPLGTFNGVVLFGPNASGMSIASGSHAGENITIPETNFRDGAMLELFRQDASGNYTLSVTDANAASDIAAAIDDVGNERSILGGIDSRLEFASSELTIESQNITAAVSRIQDVDVAKESTRLTKMNILFESGTAMLSQANQSPSSILKLLKE
jgi:flagellin